MVTIQGSIHKMVDNSNIMFESLGYVSSNMANWNTTGYKAQRFETFMGPQGSLSGTVRIDSRPASLMSTSRPLDVGIDGAGYIPITTEKGETLYTRDGSFAVNSEGYIVSKNNSIVGPGIKLPVNYHRVKIQPDGSVEIQNEKNAPFEKIGQIPIVVFKNPEGLDYQEGNLVAETKESGKPEILLDHTKVVQGKLEWPNINRYGVVNETLKINGAIISSTKVIKMMDEMYRESINLKQ